MTAPTIPDPPPGALLRTRKGPVVHVGVALGGGAVFHNAPGGGERVTSLRGFAGGGVLRVDPMTPEDRARVLGALRARRGTGERYHLLRNNCEHAVHRLLDGRARSPQLRRWMGGSGAALAGLGLALRHPGVRRALLRLLFRI